MVIPADGPNVGSSSYKVSRACDRFIEKNRTKLIDDLALYETLAGDTAFSTISEKMMFSRIAWARWEQLDDIEKQEFLDAAQKRPDEKNCHTGKTSRRRQAYQDISSHDGL